MKQININPKTYITVGYISLSSFSHKEEARYEIGNRKRPPKELLRECDHQSRAYNRVMDRPNLVLIDAPEIFCVDMQFPCVSLP